jgi:hypothetical protein
MNAESDAPVVAPVEEKPVAVPVVAIPSEVASADATPTPAATDKPPSAGDLENAVQAVADEKEAVKFVTARLKSMVTDIAVEASHRWEDLLETNTAIRTLINGHFDNERAIHRRIEEDEQKKADKMKATLGKKAAGDNHKKEDQGATASATPMPTRPFSKPLILHTNQLASGAWTPTRALKIDPAIPRERLTRENLNDLDLAGATVLKTVAHYVSIGFEGFALIVDALERSERQLVCRVLVFGKLEHKNAPDVFKIKDQTKRIEALNKITRLSPFFATHAVEDLEGKKRLVFRERARLAQKGLAATQKNVSESSMTTTMTASDSKDLLEMKLEKSCAEADANYMINEIRREVAAYQNYGVSTNAVPLLLAALQQKQNIIDHIELQVKGGSKWATLVSFMVKRGEVDLSNVPITFTTYEELKKKLETATAANVKEEVERLQTLLKHVVSASMRLSDVNTGEDGKPTRVGADCVAFEIINQMCGIAAPLSCMHLGVFTDIMSRKAMIKSADELKKRMAETMTPQAKEMGAIPSGNMQTNDEAMIDDIVALTAEIDRQQGNASEEWQERKKRLRAQFDEYMEKLEEKEKDANKVNEANAATTAAASASATAVNDDGDKLQPK